jgi:hypothetical protein
METFGIWSRIGKGVFWTFDKGLFCGDPERISWRLARPHETPPQQPAPATEESSATAPPTAIFPVEYADSDGDGIRILMEPRDAIGRVCWVVRNSRHVNPCHEFSSPEDAYAAHRRAQLAAEPQQPADHIPDATKLVAPPAPAPVVVPIRARAVLTRWGRPAVEPVPVSERLPGPEDCDDKGRCWWLARLPFPFTHWLPHWALPVPQEVTDG